jgi:imidazoleglycerol-phosphate dehydratase
MTRSAHRRRTTKETAVSVALDLDGPEGKVHAATGLPFFDHMLDQLGRHGGFDLTVEAQGDLHVDGHHTVEDVAIVIGECFREALGDKAGVRRFASAYPSTRRSSKSRWTCPGGRSSSTRSTRSPSGSARSTRS